MKDLKFYRCDKCGNVTIKIYDSAQALSCCGEKMTELVANTVDAAAEKHVPVVEIDGDIATVKVGQIAHPMTDEHYIAYIALQTDRQVMGTALEATAEPSATFVLDAAKPKACYEYCTLHGLWKSEL